MSGLLDAIGKGNAASYRIAEGVRLLVKRCYEHGEVEEIRVTGPNHKVRVAMMPRRDLIARLAAAAERGVFERHDPEAVVDRIFLTLAPAAEQEGQL